MTFVRRSGRKVMTRRWRLLSRDSYLVQRNGLALLIEGLDGFMDGLVKRVGVGEGLVGEVMRLEIAPDGFDVVQLRRIWAATRR